MIKSLTNLENKKGPHYVKQKNSLFWFLFCLLCFVLFFENWGYKSVFFDRKSVKKVWPVPLY